MDTTATPSARHGIEHLAGRPRLLVATGLLLAIALCWASIVPMARDMYGDMSGASAWMMLAGSWDARYAAMMFAMWLAMMVGMMLPSAVPAALLYFGAVRNGPNAAHAVGRTYAFAGGYVLAWTLFSILATVLQWGASVLGLLSPMIQTRHVSVAALLLVATGLYQWTPWKQACLTLGCCAVLMLLLFVGGVMSLACIGGITVFVLVEKLAPFGRASGRVAGVALVAAGAILLLIGG